MTESRERLNIVTSSLEFDWLDAHNLNRTFRALKLSREKAWPTLTMPTKGRREIKVGDAVLTCSADVAIKGSRLRSLEHSLPSKDDAVELHLPERLVARDLMGFYKKLAQEEIPPKIAYDMKSFRLNFFSLDAGFGIMPGPKKKVDWASLKIQLAPKSKDTGFLRIYELAPQTTFEETSSFEGDVDVNADLKFSTPDPVPWLSSGLKVSGRALYKTRLKFATSVITASTNQNHVVSWQFQRSRVKGEDPRGLFQTAVTIGVPQSYGMTVDELSKAISASYAVRASVKGWVFRNLTEKDQRIGIDFQKILS